MGRLEDRIGKRVPFVAPDGYFESLSDRIAERVGSYARIIPEVRQRGGFFHPRPWLAVAGSIAAAAAVFLLVLMLLPAGHETYADETETGLAYLYEDVLFDSDFDVSDEDIIKYLSEKVDNVAVFYAGIK